jgi:4-carboxymuconolactone decarboxylase
MRLPLIAANDLSPEQRPVYDDMRAGIEKNFQGFKSIADSGALMGPWNPWLHDPKFGKPIWDLTLALSVSPSLPRTAREVAILVTGTTFHSAYELYAHVVFMPTSSPPSGAACPTTSSPPSSPASAQTI